MTRRGCSSLPFLFLQLLLLLNVVTLNLLYVQGLEVTPSIVTSRHPRDELVLSRKTPLRDSPVTSWIPGISVPLEIDGGILVMPPRSEGDAQVTYAQDDPRSDPIAESSMGKSSSTLLSHREDEILDDTVKDVPNCTYKVDERKAGGWIGERSNSSVSSDSHDNANVPQLTPGNDPIDEDFVSSVSAHSRVRRQTITLYNPLWTNRNTLFVELVVVGDRSFCQKYGGNAIDRINKIVGVTNALFAPLGIVVVVVDIELWRSHDKVYVNPIKEKTLISMKEYRTKMLREKSGRPNDNLSLLTAALHAGNGGVASTGGMCSDDRSVNIVQDVNEDAKIVGSFLAHEMGHNFNMKHDGEGKNFNWHGNCRDSVSIMQKQLNGYDYDTNIRWSECSRLYLEEMKKTVDLDCLKNIPTEIYGRSSCGNGVVEEGEHCDCGPPELCKNSCCNPKTCTLAPMAICASGACCNPDTCQPHTAGTVCREASDDCDLAEYCSGSSEKCPKDAHKGDGSSCDYSNEGYCYKGKCGSHAGRCRTLWGDEARPGDSVCYNELIDRGDRAGNCGFNSGTKQYVHCNTQSEMCGTLYCNARRQTEVILSNRAQHHTKQEWVQSSNCQYVEGFGTLYKMEDWLSPDGARCGNRKMCLNQKCTQIPGTDDSLSCPRKCSGRGVCNNKGHCHCQAGYAPPDCSQPGSGGSFESGPIGGSSGGGGRPSNPVTHNPPYNRPRGTTPRQRRPMTPRPHYTNLPKVTTPSTRRPRTNKPYSYWPRTTTTPRSDRPWIPPVHQRTTVLPYDRPNLPTVDNGSSGTFLKSPGMIAVWVILAIITLLVIVLVIMCCTWDKLRRWWENTGRSQVSPVAPKAVLCIDNCFCEAISKALQWIVSTGPLGKMKMASKSADPDTRRARKKSTSYRIDVEIKRTSQPDYINTEEHLSRKLQGSVNPRQKPLLPTSSPVLHHKSLEKITRPNYQQSMSVDSGCVLDDQDEAFETPSTNVSMSSLVSAFRHYTSRTPNDGHDVENRKSNVHDHHKEVSLRRLVTDPRTGHRNSKHALPQSYQKPPDQRHSISTDPSINKEPRSSKNHNASRLSNNPFTSSNKFIANDKSLPDVHIQSKTKDNMMKPSSKKPMMPPQKARTPPRATPPRASPPRVIPSRATPPRATPPREVPPPPPVKEADGVQILQSKPVNLNRFKVLENKKNNANAKPSQSNSVSKLNSRPQLKSSTEQQNTTVAPNTTGSKNVRNIAQRFENL